jgi:plasmid maintenance system antidote protein VapI
VRLLHSSLVEIAEAIVSLEDLNAKSIAEALGVSRPTSFRILRDVRDLDSDLNHVIQAVTIRKLNKKNKGKRK